MRRRILALLALGLGLGLLAWALPPLTPETLQHFLTAAGPWAPLAGVGLMVLQSLISPIPFALVVIGLGAALGPWEGALVAWVGELLGATLAYWLARLGWQASAPPAWLSGARSFWGLLGVRLTPGLSFDLVSYACGVARLPYATFLAATMLGMIPRTAALIMFGHALWTDPREALLLVAVMLPVAGLVLLLLRRKGLRRHEGEEHGRQADSPPVV